MPSRIVVKIGSSSLTTDEGGLNLEAIDFYAGELASLREEGHEVLLVTSGAVAAGFRKIGYKIRPRLLHEKQAAAAVGSFTHAFISKRLCSTKPHCRTNLTDKDRFRQSQTNEQCKHDD